MFRLLPKLLKSATSLLTGVDYDAQPFSTKQKKSPKQVSRRVLIQRESQVGAELFGPVPAGARREFFNLDPTTWIWYEESATQKMTTRYELKGDKILISQDDGKRSVYGYMDDEKQLHDFAEIVRRYYDVVATKIYRVNPATGEALPN